VCLQHGAAAAFQVCGSMPYDDTDVKKMIKYQTERKVGFSRHKKISAEVKELIHGILEADLDRRYRIADVLESVWMPQTQDQCCTAAANSTSTSSEPSRPATGSGSVKTEAAGPHHQVSREPVSDSDGAMQPTCARHAEAEVEQSDDRRLAASSVNNNDVAPSPTKLLRTHGGATISPAAGVRQTTVTQRRTVESGSVQHMSASSRYARMRLDETMTAAEAPAGWTTGAVVVVRDRVRAGGR